MNKVIVNSLALMISRLILWGIKKLLAGRSIKTKSFLVVTGFGIVSAALISYVAVKRVLNPGEGRLC